MDIFRDEKVKGTDILTTKKKITPAPAPAVPHICLWYVAPVARWVAWLLKSA